MTVLNAIEKSETLMDFNQTYGKWHEKARKELNDILKCQYSIISIMMKIRNGKLKNWLTETTLKLAMATKM